MLIFRTGIMEIFTINFFLLRFRFFKFYFCFSFFWFFYFAINSAKNRKFCVFFGILDFYTQKKKFFLYRFLIINFRFLP